MRGGHHLAKQLDCTTCIASTQNNGIHGILFGTLTTFSRLSRLAYQRKPASVNMSSGDWTTTKSNDCNRQMPYEGCSRNSISGSAMIVGLKMTHISSEHHSTGIFLNGSSCFCHISYFRHTMIWNRCTSLTLRVVKPTAS